MPLLKNLILANKIYQTLTKQRFASWYGRDGKFEAHITGDDNAPTKNEILDQIEDIFDLNLNPPNPLTPEKTAILSLALNCSDDLPVVNSFLVINGDWRAFDNAEIIRSPFPAESNESHPLHAHFWKDNKFLLREFIVDKEGFSKAIREGAYFISITEKFTSL